MHSPLQLKAFVSFWVVLLRSSKRPENEHIDAHCKGNCVRIRELCTRTLKYKENPCPPALPGKFLAGDLSEQIPVPGRTTTGVQVSSSDKKIQKNYTVALFCWSGFADVSSAVSCTQ